MMIRFLIIFLFVFQLNAQTIAEKKAGGMPVGSDLVKDLQKVLVEVNKELIEDHAELHQLYGQVHQLFRENAPPDVYRDLLDRINQVRTEIEMLQNNWREMATSGGSQEGYALWHQPESTLGQLVVDYGSQNYVYLMTPEIASIPVSVDSNIPIPRASWSEMLELILVQNGVGFKQLNPYLRQLYLIKQDRSSIALITNRRQDLDYFPPEARIAFMLTPEPSEVRRVFAFLERFVNPNSSVLQVIGRDIMIIASAAEILDLLKLYDFVISNRGDKEYRVRTVKRVDVEEMAKILGAIFDQFGEAVQVVEKAPPAGKRAPPQAVNLQRERSELGEANGLRIIPLKNIAQAIFLIGTKREIEKAEEIIEEVENQVGSARQRVIWWYTTKNSNPEELAQVLERIYSLMIQTGAGREMEERLEVQENALPTAFLENRGPPGYSPPGPPAPFSNIYRNDFYQQGAYVVNPAPAQPRLLPEQAPNRGRNNFIVDLKTGSIVMVVEADLLPQIKELVKKLDVAKKMVQIEILVVEKRLNREDDFGLNLLRLGDAAKNRNFGGVLFNGPILTHDQNNNTEQATRTPGILEFILSQKRHDGFPAFDLIYKFLISQEDVRVNACPTIVTVNQVPAKLAIVEEITLDLGATFINNNGALTPQTSFTRAQYGTTIIVTPTIHAHDDNSCEDVDYVTLDTDITFDSFGLTTVLTRGQPPVTRRKVTNQVNIPDGQTVVIGGLRQKNTDDAKTSIPVIGEIPGFGKLFSLTSMNERNVELIFFITPKIIRDPADDFMRLRAEEMLKRPGDIPEFMCELFLAQEAESNRLYAGTLNVLFGRPWDRCIPENYYQENAKVYPYIPPPSCVKECPAEDDEAEGIE